MENGSLISGEDERPTGRCDRLEAHSAQADHQMNNTDEEDDDDDFVFQSADPVSTDHETKDALHQIEPNEAKNIVNISRDEESFETANDEDSFTFHHATCVEEKGDGDDRSQIVPPGNISEAQTHDEHTVSQKDQTRIPAPAPRAASSSLQRQKENVVPPPPATKPPLSHPHPPLQNINLSPSQSNKLGEALSEAMEHYANGVIGGLWPDELERDRSALKLYSKLDGSSSDDCHTFKYGDLSESVPQAAKSFTGQKGNETFNTAASPSVFNWSSSPMRTLFNTALTDWVRISRRSFDPRGSSTDLHEAEFADSTPASASSAVYSTGNAIPVSPLAEFYHPPWDMRLESDFWASVRLKLQPEVDWATKDEDEQTNVAPVIHQSSAASQAASATVQNNKDLSSADLALVFGEAFKIEPVPPVIVPQTNVPRNPQPTLQKEKKERADKSLLEVEDDSSAFGAFQVVPSQTTVDDSEEFEFHSVPAMDASSI